MKKIKNILSVLCRTSAVDKDSNLASLFDIIEEITITSNLKVGGNELDNGNILNIPFEVFTLWEREGDVKEKVSSEIKISVVDPQGKERERALIPLDFESGKKRMRVRVKVPVFEFFGYGIYIFKFYIKEKEKFNLKQETSIEVKSEIKV